jgi:hypothetical protein
MVQTFFQLFDQALEVAVIRNFIFCRVGHVKNITRLIIAG